MIPFLLRRGHQVGEAIDHHGGLGNDANDDAQDVYLCRNKAVAEEIPDGVDAQWDIDQNGGYKTWIIFTSEDEEHHDVSRGVQRGIVGRPEAPVGIGYHYVVRRNGQIELGRPEFMIGAHCQNHNAHSIGVCYEGGLNARGQPEDTRTPEQKSALRALLKDLHRRYPQALIVGHHDLNPHKACPCIPDVAKEYSDLQPK